ncbi:hypothetical protein R3P38DRAFT_3175563 [Favolaschia claudopus]|uniref:Uncharacterized protein n=1 Tax=Favolaschia claudopus TaxID=2862362 RepID=A0AAW0D182_9AGAR
MSSSTQASVSSEVSAAVRPLNALYYSLNGAYEVPVPTVFLTSPSAFSFPNLEHLLLSSRTPGSIRTVRGAVEHSTESGEIMTTRFVCFFENHPNLPFNTTLNIQGAILVMRAAADGVTLINMDSSELWLADLVGAVPQVVPTGFGPTYKLPPSSSPWVLFANTLLSIPLATLWTTQKMSLLQFRKLLYLLTVYLSIPCEVADTSLISFTPHLGFNMSRGACLIPQCLLDHVELNKDRFADVEIKQFDAMHYTPHGNIWVQVPTLNTVYDDNAFSTPCIDFCFQDLIIDPWKTTTTSWNKYITTPVSIGEVVTIKFVCIFLRHEDVPFNERLNIWGDVLLMRTEADGYTITDMSQKEADLVEQVMERLLHAVRGVQESRESLIGPIVLNVPGGTHSLSASEPPISAISGADQTISLHPRVRDFNFENLEAGNSFHLLTARLYSFAGPSFVHVPTTCATTPHLRTFPHVEAILKSSALQPHIHHIDASVHHRLPSGRLEYTEFLCFFKRHKRLPRNPGLNIQGEVLIMRARDDGEMVSDMLEAEADLADLVARALVPGLRAFQKDSRQVVESLTVYAPNVHED